MFLSFTRYKIKYNCLVTACHLGADLETLTTKISLAIGQLLKKILQIHMHIWVKPTFCQIITQLILIWILAESGLHSDTLITKKVSLSRGPFVPIQKKVSYPAVTLYLGKLFCLHVKIVQQGLLHRKQFLKNLWSEVRKGDFNSCGKWSSRVLPLMLWWSLVWFPYFYSDCPWPYCG